MKSERIERWEKLLSNKRVGSSKASGIVRFESGRSSFDQDYDRIVFSSAFRRLQDKTQVFPLSPSDYTRTRLTHSIEVSCVGRSLGIIAGNKLREFGLISTDRNPVTASDVGTIVAAACLAHDTGNPPFGHSGEDAIQHWASTNSVANRLLTSINNDAEKSDILNFEGNAQSFRLYSKLLARQRLGGLQLTAATIGALTKYPCPSNRTTPGTQNVAYKKFGYFQDDKDLALEAFNELGLIRAEHQGSFARHPFAFLMEAADDICYAIIDIEDAARLGIISYKKAEEVLSNLLTSDQRGNSEGRETDDLTRISIFRALAINNLADDCGNVFCDNLEAIEEGSFYQSLIENCSKHEQYNALKHLAKSEVYKDKRVLQVEYVGYQVIGGLLEMFAEAICNGSSDKKSKKTFRTLPQSLFTYS